MAENNDRETVEAVIARYFPETAHAPLKMTDTPVTVAALKALDIGGAELSGGARFGRWDAAKERERLKTLRQSLRKAKAALDGLSPAVRTQLLSAASGEPERDLERAMAAAKERRKRLPRGVAAAISDAHNALERDNGRPYAVARMVADSGLPAGGQRDWRAVAAVDACRNLWAECTGKVPSDWPRDGRPDDMRFLAFLSDVMKALDMKGRRGAPPNPRAAVRSWRDAHNLGKKPRS